jgi:predicted dehydrogenase
MKTIRWGIISVSGHYHLRCSSPLKEARGLEIAAIASRDVERARAAADEYGIERAYGSYDELLADSTIDAVYIPLPNHMHLEWIKKAADAGKHILCEKPLALSVDDVNDAIAYTEAKGVALMEAFMYKLHPQWVRARELVRIGEIGSVTSIQSHFFYNNRDPNNIRNQLKAGGGALRDIGCYTVSSARFLLAREPERVFAHIQFDPEFGTDRLVSGVLDFGDVHASFIVGTQSSSQQKVQVFGSSGTLRVELPFNAFPDVPLELSVETGIGTRTIYCGPADQYGIEFEAFSDAIRDGGPIPIPSADALANQRVLDALFLSAERGAWEAVQGD